MKHLVLANCLTIIVFVTLFVAGCKNKNKSAMSANSITRDEVIQIINDQVRSLENYTDERLKQEIPNQVSLIMDTYFEKNVLPMVVTKQFAVVGKSGSPIISVIDNGEDTMLLITSGNKKYSVALVATDESSAVLAQDDSNNISAKMGTHNNTTFLGLEDGRVSLNMKPNFLGVDNKSNGNRLHQSVFVNY